MFDIFFIANDLPNPKRRDVVSHPRMACINKILLHYILQSARVKYQTQVLVGDCLALGLGIGHRLLFIIMQEKD